MKKLILLSALCFSTLTLAAQKPLALIWNGPGVCRPGCSGGAKTVAKRAGYRIKYVTPSTSDFSIFKEAKLWIQPGGKSVTAAESMSPSMMQEIRDFVANGGGYVGFCAGAFISTQKIGTSGEEGYGIIPGETELYKKEGSERAMFKVWTPNHGERWMLYAGGPYIKISDEELKEVDGQVIARYPDGSVAGIQGRFGKGKVSVVGFHPEASFLWKLWDGKIDHDGSDVFYAVDMVKYATSQD